MRSEITKMEIKSGSGGTRLEVTFKTPKGKEKVFVSETVFGINELVERISQLAKITGENLTFDGETVF